MADSDVIELEGTVVDVLGGGMYKVRLNDMDLEINAYAAGKMKQHNIKIIPGDIVKVELSPYEPTKGRIVYRSINKEIERGRSRGPMKPKPTENSEENSSAA